MSILTDRGTAGIPAVPHADWCDPLHHFDAGSLDQHCSSAPRVVEPSSRAGLCADPGAVVVTVEQHADRDGGFGEWRPQPPVVALEVRAESGAELTPAEARMVAAMLVAAANTAAGGDDRSLLERAAADLLVAELANRGVEVTTSDVERMHSLLRSVVDAVAATAGGGR